MIGEFFEDLSPIIVIDEIPFLESASDPSLILQLRAIPPFDEVVQFAQGDGNAFEVLDFNAYGDGVFPGAPVLPLPLPQQGHEEEQGGEKMNLFTFMKKYGLLKSVWGARLLHFVDSKAEENKRNEEAKFRQRLIGVDQGLEENNEDRRRYLEKLEEKHVIIRSMEGKTAMFQLKKEGWDVLNSMTSEDRAELLRRSKYATSKKLSTAVRNGKISKKKVVGGAA